MIDNAAMLYATAASVALVHTLLGPDHYLPFVAMSRAGDWSLRKTVAITLLCGIGHVLSSAVLGLIGIAFGVALFKLEGIERFRGDLAGWLLIAFGLVYFLWGVRRAIRNQPHSHFHAHADGVNHTHEHTHHVGHLHVHDVSEPSAEVTGQTVASPRRTGVIPWVLFTVFLFGPCEPLVPILMYAAAKGNAWTVAGVTTVFGVTTLAIMTMTVLSVRYVVGLTPLPRFHRFGHAVAGLVVLACGVAVQAGL